MLIGNGWKDHLARLNRLSGRTLIDYTGAALLDTAKELEEDIRFSLNDGSISGPGHIPSLPGEPPNTDTHDLEQSIHVTELVEVADYLQTTVSEGGAQAPYAPTLEYGGGNIAERPHMRPAAERARQEHQNRLKQAIEKTARGK